eukprot:scaffold24920_cov67-Phaeocystis_antarctica.AAC.2
MQQVQPAARCLPPAPRPPPTGVRARGPGPTPSLPPLSRPDIGRLVERRSPHEHRSSRSRRSAHRPAAARATCQDAAEHARAARARPTSSLKLMH